MCWFMVAIWWPHRAHIAARYLWILLQKWKYCESSRRALRDTRYCCECGGKGMRRKMLLQNAIDQRKKPMYKLIYSCIHTHCDIPVIMGKRLKTRQMITNATSQLPQLSTTITPHHFNLYSYSSFIFIFIWKKLRPCGRFAQPFLSHSLSLSISLSFVVLYLFICK